MDFTRNRADGDGVKGVAGTECTVTKLGDYMQGVFEEADKLQFGAFTITDTKSYHFRANRNFSDQFGIDRLIVDEPDAIERLFAGTSTISHEKLQVRAWDVIDLQGIFEFPSNALIITEIDIKETERVNDSATSASRRSVNLAMAFETGSQESTAAQEAKSREQEAKCEAASNQKELLKLSLLLSLDMKYDQYENACHLVSLVEIVKVIKLIVVLDLMMKHDNKLSKSLFVFCARIVMASAIFVLLFFFVFVQFLGVMFLITT